MATINIGIGLSDLEALLGSAPGGLPEVNLTISQNVMQAYADKHLKALMNSEPAKSIAAAHQRATDGLTAAVKSEVEKMIGKVNTDWNGKVTSVELRPEVRDRVVTVARSAVEEELKSALVMYDDTRLKALKEETIQKLMDAIDSKFTSGLESLIGNEVRRRLAQVADIVKAEAHG